MPRNRKDAYTPWSFFVLTPPGDWVYVTSSLLT